MIKLQYISAALAGALLLTGCAGGPAFQAGQAAEREGLAHVAYDRYLEAAVASPDNAMIAGAMRRVAPTAAAYWTAQARIAQAEGRYADAWRAAMRSLDIRPDQQEAVELVQALERDQPRAIAAAQNAWMRGGTRTLPAARQPAPQSGESSPRVASRTHPSRTRGTSPRQSARSNSEMPRIEQPESVESEAAAVASADEPAIEPAPRRPARRPRREPPPEPRRATRVPREAPPVLAGAAVHPLEGDAMFTLTLTERDKDDERRLPLIESISVELCDVDDDNGGEIDLDLFEGDRRIHKIRKLGQGRSRLFRAPSGGWYRLRVMRIRVEPPLVELALFAAS